MSVYKIRIASTGGKSGGQTYYSIAIPREVGERIAGRLFRFELTEEGLLFRPVRDADNPPITLPAWADEK